MFLFASADTRRRSKLSLSDSFFLARFYLCIKKNQAECANIAADITCERKITIEWKWEIKASESEPHKYGGFILVISI